MHCGFCGAELKESDKFCPECGMPVPGATQGAPAEPAAGAALAAAAAALGVADTGTGLTETKAPASDATGKSGAKASSAPENTAMHGASPWESQAAGMNSLPPLSGATGYTSPENADHYDDFEKPVPSPAYRSGGPSPSGSYSGGGPSPSGPYGGGPSPSGPYGSGGPYGGQGSPAPEIEELPPAWQQTPHASVSAPVPAKNSTLSIAALVLAFIIPLAGIICAVIDLRHNGTDMFKHDLSRVAIIIGIALFVLRFIF